MAHIFSSKVYTHPDAPRPFWHERDAKGWCADHNADPTLIERYDSTSEYNRWRELQQLERQGKISQLKRQVKYLLLPEQSEEVFCSYRMRRAYKVRGNTFDKRKDAMGYCKANAITAAEIQREEVAEPKKKIVILERPSYYTADFTYVDANGNHIVEDCKSEFTRKQQDYVLRRKLMLYINHIRIYEYIPPKKKK